MPNLSGGMKVAIYIITWIFVYLTAVTFVPMFAEFPEAGKAQANIIVPFFLGIIGTLVGYYWGKSSSGPPNQFDLPAKMAAARIEEERIEAAKIAAAKVEEERIAAAKKEAERLEAERLAEAEELAKKLIEQAKGNENAEITTAV